MITAHAAYLILSAGGIPAYLSVRGIAPHLEIHGACRDILTEQALHIITQSLVSLLKITVFLQLLEMAAIKQHQCYRQEEKRSKRHGDDFLICTQLNIPFLKLKFRHV